MSAEDFLELRLEISDKLRQKIASLSDPQRAEIKRQALASLREFSTPHGLSFAAEILMLTGAKRPAV